MDWKIRPLVGIGDLEFGMTSSEVAAIIGNKIKFTRPIDDGSVNEYREGGKLPVCNYHNDQLRCIDIYSMNYETRIDDLFIFKDDPQIVVNRLEKMNGAPSVVFGICYFKDIGVSLGKWINPQTLAVRPRPNRAEDLRSISISAKGVHFGIFTDDKKVSLSSEKMG